MNLEIFFIPAFQGRTFTHTPFPESEAKAVNLMK
jgi:hypothetical protein